MRPGVSHSVAAVFAEVKRIQFSGAASPCWPTVELVSYSRAALSGRRSARGKPRSVSPSLGAGRSPHEMDGVLLMPYDRAVIISSLPPHNIRNPISLMRGLHPAPAEPGYWWVSSIDPHDPSSNSGSSSCPSDFGPGTRGSSADQSADESQDFRWKNIGRALLVPTRTGLIHPWSRRSVDSVERRSSNGQADQGNRCRRTV